MYALLGTYVPKQDPQLAPIAKSAIVRKTPEICGGEDSALYT